MNTFYMLSELVGMNTGLLVHVRTIRVFYQSLSFAAICIHNNYTFEFSALTKYACVFKLTSRNAVHVHALRMRIISCLLIL